MEHIITQHESKTLEFKENGNSKENLIASVIAFANTSGGKIVLGIEDRTKRVVGIKNPHDEEERLSSIISDAIKPFLLPTIEILPWRDTHILIIEVPLSPSRPHYITAKGIQKSTYVRVGSTNRLADDQMIESIRRSLHVHSYDEEACNSATMDELDNKAINIAFKTIKPIHKNDLYSLGIMIKENAKDIPSIGGVLFFGKNKEKYFPDAWIQAGCFQGINKNTILDSMDIKAHFDESINQAFNFIRRHISVGLRIEKQTHQELWEIPQVALREAILNAVIHTDYSLHGAPIRIAIFDDRVEIENPGLIPQGLTIEDIKAGYSKIRNRVIARIFRELKQTEQWGSGIGRIITACLEAGLKEPAFEEIANRFRVTLYRIKIKAVYMDEIDQKILEILTERGPLSTKTIAQHIQLSERSTRPRLVSLIEKGRVQELARSNKDPNKKYMIVS